MAREHLNRQSFRLLSANDDAGSPVRGSLIPGARPRHRDRIGPVHSKAARRPGLRVAGAVAVLALLSGSVATVGLGTVASVQPASPAVVIVDPELGTPTPLSYGVELALAEPRFHTETRTALIAAGESFLEVDLAARMVRYFEDGVLLLSAPVVAVPASGSWWETPPGLYRVERKTAERFSTFGQVYLPWSIGFQGNFLVHGTPYQPDGTPVVADEMEAGIRLSNADAKRLFSVVGAGTTVLVHDAAPQADRFRYGARVSDLSAPHYLLADIESNTVLASSDRAQPVPIASVTKLMTALVAAEHLDLEGSVFASAPTFVESLIPRLGERQSVSVYGLLQLLLVESSNEAAEVIAAELGRTRFIELMNEQAADIGMRHSQFVDPSGLGDGNVSSLADLLRLLQYLHENRRFILDLTTDTYTLGGYPRGEFGELTNFNSIEGVESLVGGKVGETEAAGKTSASIHRVVIDGDERLLALVVLGSQERADDIKKLLTYAKERFGAEEATR